MIQEFTLKKMNNTQIIMDCNSPSTPEATYYRLLFRKFYGLIRDDIIPHYWQPKWDKHGNVITQYVDPSARTLEVYE